jgi:hypothetical protein
MNLTNEVKRALKAKGYKLPEFKTADQRAKFIGKHGYDPRIVIIQTIRMVDATGMAEGWEERIPAP